VKCAHHTQCILNGLERYATNMLLSLLFLTILPVSLNASTSTTESTSSEEVWLTIFVHGMMSIKHHLSMENLFRFVGDDIENCLYTKTINIMRTNPFFFKNQAMQYPGLQKIETCNAPCTNASASMAILFDYLYKSCGCSGQRRYYTFGWSGLLSACARYRDAKIFFDALNAEVTQLKQAGFIPKIRIIGYSHGGNVTLNLAAIARDIGVKPTFCIDELVLVGMPVQQETDYLINDALFKRVYHVYSCADRVQPLDLFSSKSFFSQRTFTARPGFKLPAKLKQIELRITRCNTRVRNSQGHKRLLATDLEHYGIESGQSRLLRTASPGHAELWFFGWTPLNYRRSFPLYPLPCMAVVPFIGNYFDTVCSADSSADANSFIFDIRPEFGHILIKNSNATTTKTSFLNPQELTNVSSMLLNRAPEPYLETHYKIEIGHAFEQAQVQQLAQDLCNPTTLSKKKLRQRRRIASLNKLQKRNFHTKEHNEQNG